MVPTAANPWGKPTDLVAASRSGASKTPALKSFKEALDGQISASNPKVNVTCSSFKGFPAILLSDEDVEKLAAPFSYSLIGKFSFRRPRMEDVRSFFLSLKLSGSFSVGLIDARHILIRFTNDLDYSRVFSRRSYYVFNCQMRLLKWSPHFDIKEESPVTPVWIALPNMRIHFINHHILFSIGSLFGRPLQVDQATASLSRPSVARVLVEMDVTHKHPREIWVGSEAYGYLQKVEFEDLPVFCNHCKIHGHEALECFVLHPELRKSIPKIPPSSDSGKITLADAMVSNPTVDYTSTSGLVDERLPPTNFHLKAGPGKLSWVEKGKNVIIDKDFNKSISDPSCSLAQDKHFSIDPIASAVVPPVLIETCIEPVVNKLGSAPKCVLNRSISAPSLNFEEGISMELCLPQNRAEDDLLIFPYSSVKELPSATDPNLELDNGKMVMALDAGEVPLDNEGFLPVVIKRRKYKKSRFPVAHLQRITRSKTSQSSFLNV